MTSRHCRNPLSPAFRVIVSAAVLSSACVVNAQFALTEVKRGIAVLMGTHRITRAIGLARTKELTMLGEIINAETAAAYGLVHRVVENLEAETNAFAAKFRDLPPLTVGICKQIAEASLTGDTQELEIALQTGLLNTADFQEGVASFFEKRPPKFVGG
jgi:enoyl-CoA hydratase/carnithine racemase